jgi:uncharacterized cupredoxin-like copper-binding protein
MNTMKPNPHPLPRRRALQRLALLPGLPLALGGVLPRVARAHGSGGHAQAPTTVDDTQYDWGRAGRPQDARRSVTIGMSDRMRFTPDRLALRLGDTVRLVVVNRGRALHELVLGTEAELRTHAEAMKRHPDMAHDAPYMAHVPPGQRVQIVWHFNRPGRFLYGCLLPGHWDAGMVGHILVKETSR